jgi:hypothetical protein
MRDTRRRRIVPLREISDPLPHDPVVARNLGRRFLEIAEQFRSSARDVLPFIRNYVVAEVGMPLAESTHDQAVIRGADVELRQHLPPPTLEPGLEVMRAVRDLRRVGSGALGVFRGVGR